MSSTNASGLKPSESKALAERSPRLVEGSIIQALKEMYSCSPNDNTFSIYTEDAVFHDPVGIAKGVGSIRSQFVALAKLFPRADIVRLCVLENPPASNPNLLLIDQDVSYFRKPDSSSPFKTVNSLLTITMDGNNKVVRHIEEWDHEKTSSKEDGFFGMLNEQRKKFTASLTDAMMGKGTK